MKQSYCLELIKIAGIDGNFLKKIEDILGSEAKEYLACMNGSPYRGLSVNMLKCSVEDFVKIAPFDIDPTDFSANVFYFDCGEMKAGNHPYHRAGLYYIQEPSAAAPAEALDVQPGEFVLDLCASPGGKSAQIAARLGGTGLLWSNEYVSSRIQPLVSNMERLGVRNVVISNCHPASLCEKLQGCFDRVLVDAPCSGEGMFRKNRDAEKQWSEELVRSCAVRQSSILHSAAGALRQGGILVYSTCTFSPEENEEVVGSFLKEHAEFELLPIALPFGRSGMKEKSVDNPHYLRRIFPMDGGEGQFIAKFRKAGDMPRFALPLTKIPPASKEKWEAFQSFVKENLTVNLSEHAVIVNDSVYLLPQSAEGAMPGIVRAGVLAGTVSKGRFTPSHQLFLSLKKTDSCAVLDFTPDDFRLIDYLKGCEIDAPTDRKGYVSVCVDGFPLGFGKASGGRLKNHYPKGLRLL